MWGTWRQNSLNACKTKATGDIEDQFTKWPSFKVYLLVKKYLFEKTIELRTYRSQLTSKITAATVSKCGIRETNFILRHLFVFLSI